MIFIAKYVETRILEQRVEVRDGENPEEIALQAIKNNWNSRRVLCEYGPDFSRGLISVRLGDEKDQELGDKHR